MSTRPSRIGIVLVALAADHLFGELPNEYHPVAWFGKLVERLVRRAPQGDAACELRYGALIAASGVAVAVLPAVAVEAVSRGHPWLGLVAQAAALKTVFAWRALTDAGALVRRDLERGRPEDTVTDLQALVSRDTTQLDTSHLAAAAVESLAENAGDSVVAPLFYYTLFGLPGAFAYRAANTLDSMIGYRGRYEHLGKVSAKLDDALNWVPARLAACAIVAGARVAGEDAQGARLAMRRDHAKTASPNAGYPMSAMAGALGVRLEKVDHYALNAQGRAPCASDIVRASRVVDTALGLTVAALILTLALRRRS